MKSLQKSTVWLRHSLRWFYQERPEAAGIRTTEALSQVKGSQTIIPIMGIFTMSCLAFQSCDRDKNNPGYDYFPDMFYSKAYETYAPNPNSPDGKTLMAPVAGTISREAELYPYKKTDADLLKAASLKNPFSTDTQNLARGKIVYQNVCLQCHGVKADGKGHLFTSEKYPYPPANLISQKTINRSDGEIFHIITVGFGIMAPHDIIVRPEDRWKTVLYVRSLQKNSQ
jgi:mono/diheme cytochrome c family protein